MPVRPKKKKHKGGSLPNFGGANLAELGVLAGLLPLLRSGALQSLLDAGAPGVKGALSALPKSKKPKVSSVAAEKAPGWKAVKPVKSVAVPSAGQARPAASSKSEQMPKSLAGDTLLPEGFSCDGGTPVTVAKSVSDLKIDTPSVCLATRQEALKAEMEIKAQVPIALLTPVPVGEGAQLIHVAVKDQAGISQIRRRFFFQLGNTPIRYMEDAPNGGEVEVETEKVVLGVMQNMSPCWDSALQNPKRVFGAWLRNTAGVESVIEIQRPSLVGDKLQAVVVLKKGSRDPCLKASGKGEGVFTRVFVERETDHMEREFRTVPVPLEQDLASALRTASSLKQHWGIVPYGKGVGIRVAAKVFEATLDVIQPAQDKRKFVGDLFLVSGIPLSWAAEDLDTFFKNKWEMTPIFSKRIGFTKTWTVRAGAPPLHFHWQHGNGLAAVSKKETSKNSVGSSNSSNSSSSGKAGTRLVWSGRPARNQQLSQKKEEQQAQVPAPGQQRPRQQQQPQQKRWPQQQPQAQPLQQQKQQQEQLGQQQQQQQEQPGGDLSPAVLAAIQAAISAAISPLRQELADLKRYATDEVDTESEDENTMSVDLRSKRGRDEDSSDPLKVRKPKVPEGRPSQQQRR